MLFTHPDSMYWAAIPYVGKIGINRLKIGLTYFGSIKAFFAAKESDWKMLKMTSLQIEILKTMPWRTIEKDIGWYTHHNGHLLTYQDEHYPSLLKEIPGAPPVLYVQGESRLLQSPQLAIVGSRNPTPMGIENATRFASALIASGLVVTSGLALGIDAAAHQGALKTNGKTIAVLGAGLRHIYPRSNQSLANDIAKTGALVTEFPLDVLPVANHFPMRNRLISGLSLGVLVVEAALKSGSLITARYAADQGREVFAIPSSIHHPLGKGCHYLIRQGAKLVETVEDILVELTSLRGCLSFDLSQVHPSEEIKKADLDTAHQQLLMQIGYEPTAIETIIARGGLTSGQLSSMLLLLELEGYIEAVAGGYIRVR